MTIDQRNSVGRMWGVIGLGLAAITFLGYSWLGTPWHQTVFLPLPYRQMEVPLLWWAVYLIYLVVSSQLLRYDPRVCRLLFFDWLLLHFQWLLVLFDMTAPILETVGRAYSIYIKWVILCVVMATSYWAGKTAGQVWNQLRRGDTTAVIRLPISVGTLFMIGYTAWHGRWMVVSTGLAGYSVGWYAERWQLHDRIVTNVKRMVQPTTHQRRLEWGGLGGLVLLAFCLRFAWYLHLVSVVGFDYHSGFPAASDDGQFYHSAASQIAASPRVLLTRSNPIVSSSWDPLYPLLLGLWYWLTGIRFTPAVFLQCLFGSLLVVLVYFIGKELGEGDRSTGYLTAGFATVSQPLIFSSTVYGIEALYVPVLACWVWAAIRYAENRRINMAVIWMGLCGGLMLGLRRYAPLFLLGLLPWLLWVPNQRPLSLRFLDWLRVVLIACVVYLPIELMYVHNGQARLLSRGNPMYWEMPSKFPDLVPDNQRLIQLGIDPFHNMTATLGNTLHHPVAVAKAVGQILPLRLRAFFFWYPFGNFHTTLLFNPTIQNCYTPVAEFYFALLVFVGIVWTLHQSQQSRVVAFLLLFTIGVHVFVHCVLFITNSIRYSIPVRPYLMSFAATAVVRFVRETFKRGATRYGVSRYPGLQQSSRA